MFGCGDSVQPVATQPDAATVDAAVDAPATLDVCPGAGREKIKFPRAESCGNDGSVEWCVPDNDPQLQAMLATINPAISCAPGGGRAGCYSPAGLLLCTYPTRYPDQCLSRYGEMTAEVWGDMCELAALPEITEIVPTIFE
jgi:hypothetical protein